MPDRAAPCCPKCGDPCRWTLCHACRDELARGTRLCEHCEGDCCEECDYDGSELCEVCDGLAGWWTCPEHGAGPYTVELKEG